MATSEINVTRRPIRVTIYGAVEVDSNVESAMLEFTCSTCGKRVQGDDAIAGQRVQCPGCGAVMITPSPAPIVCSKRSSVASDTAFMEDTLPGLPPQIPEGLADRLTRWATRGVMIATALTVIALLIPAVRKVREAAHRTESTQNLKRIGLAFHEFHDINGRLPFNGTKPAVPADNTSGSWAFMILPFVSEGAMFRANDTSRPVDAFMCPGRGRPAMCTGAGGPGAWTDYFLNPFINDGNGRPNAPDIHMALKGITDGTSNTILLGQGQINPDDYNSADVTVGFTDIIYNGGSPALCRGSTTVILGPDSSNPPSRPGAWGGPFRQGMLASWADATVRMWPYAVGGGTIANGIARTNGDLAAYLTPTGGEVVLICCE